MPMRSSATEALNELGWKSLEQIRLLHRLTMAFKYLHGHVDIELDVKLNRNVHNHDTRRRNDVRLPLNKRNWGQQRCIQGFQNVFAYGCPDRGREFDKK